METDLLLEILGYASALVIVASLMMRSMVRLRTLNVIGSAGYVVYGFLIGALPVAGLNILIMLVHLVHLRPYLAAALPTGGSPARNRARRELARYLKAR